jgi:hypothetical protein
VKPKNRATPEQERELREIILGGRSGGGQLSQARIGSDRDVVSTFVVHASKTYTTVQVGMQLPSQNNKRNTRDDSERKVLNRNLVWWALINFLGWDDSQRGRIVGLQIIRIGAERNYLAPWDNLPANLKNVLDAVCAWIGAGEDVLLWDKAQMQRIGDWDDMLIQSDLRPSNRIRLTEQQGTDQWDQNKTGVRIRFKRLRPGEVSTASMTGIALRRRRAKRAARKLRGDRRSLWRYLSS